jgi:histidine kinase
MDYFRRHLGLKLLLSYLAVIAAGLFVLVLASQSILPLAFNRHMAGMMNGNRGNGLMSLLYADYRAGFNETLVYAALASGVAAILLSLIFSRSVVAPVTTLSLAARRIADGHYDERVRVNGGDELAQLAERFNLMAEKLDQMEAMRRQLIGDVSHELRTPLTAIKGSMEGLMDGMLPAAPETYRQIYAEADRLNRLVDDLQELSRVEAHAFELRLKPVEVSSLVYTVTKRLAPQVEFKRLALNIELAPGLPPLLADEDRAVQILVNLVGNAIQYTPEGGKIFVTARRSGAEVQISVRDTGRGISPEHLPYIFDRFYRVDKSRSRRAGGGSGIGLTITRALVEAHGGHIHAKSAGEGQGSMFTLTLPVAK